MKIFLVFITFSNLLFSTAHSQLQIPANIRKTADSLNLLVLGSYSANTEYICDQSMTYFTGVYGSVIDCSDLKEQLKKLEDKRFQKENTSFYVLTYKLIFTPTSHYVYKMVLEANGDLAKDVLLPDCINTSACDVRIDSLQAIDSAINSGLDDKFGILNDGIGLNLETMKFVWMIKNKTSKKGNKGLLIYIDAQTGKRLTEKDEVWHQITYTIPK